MPGEDSARSDARRSPRPRSSPRRRSGRRRRAAAFVSRSWKWFTAAIGAAGASAALLFALFPAIKPHEQAPCPTQSAAFEAVANPVPMTRGDYFRLTDDTTPNVSAARLAERGVLLRFKVSTTGYLGERLTVATRVLTLGEVPISGDELENPAALILQPEKCEHDEYPGKIWTPLPDRRGRYKVELRLLEESGEDAASPYVAVVTRA